LSLLKKMTSIELKNLLNLICISPARIGKSNAVVAINSSIEMTKKLAIENHEAI
jgi:hypothetical protein